MPAHHRTASGISQKLAALVACAALTACGEATAPKHLRLPQPAFLVMPLWPDTVGICLGANSPSGTYSFSWVIQNGQTDDIHDVTSPTSQTMSPGECLVPWRRTTPLPPGVLVDVIVTETGTPPGVALDSVEVQDRYGNNLYFSSTDTVQVDEFSGGALTFYHQLVAATTSAPLPVSLSPLPGPDPSKAFGQMTLVLNPQVPPNPCGPEPAPAGPAAALCGVIHNPGGETFTGGELTIAGRSLPLGAGALTPPSPCRTYVIQGAVGVPVGLLTLASNDPGAVTLRFDSQEHPGGAIGGSPGVGGGASAGLGSDAAGSAAGQPGACLVRFGP